MKDETQLATYLLESYARGRDGDEAHTARQRLDKAARSLAVAGVRVRYVRTIAVPADDTCFHVIASESAADALRVAARAGVAVDRVCKASELRPRRRPR